MGMGGGFGQTGVGSATTQSNQPQMGGKGGGYGTSPDIGTNPYASGQPQQPQAQAQSFQPMGGNAFGYNMSRLAQRMDPSASLPSPQLQQPSAASTSQQPSQMGGKGGGQPGVFGIPQELEPFAIDAVARAYGYQPYQPTFFEPQYGMQQGYGQQFMPQQDPFYAGGYDPYEERMAQMDRQYQDMLDRMQRQMVDMREQMYDLPEPFEEFSVGETEEEAAATAAEEAAAPAAPTPLGRDAARQQAKAQGIRGAGGMNAQKLANVLGSPVTDNKGRTFQPQAPNTQPAAAPTATSLFGREVTQPAATTKPPKTPATTLADRRQAQKTQARTTATQTQPAAQAAPRTASVNLGGSAQTVSTVKQATQAGKQAVQAAKASGDKAAVKTAKAEAKAATKEAKAAGLPKKAAGGVIHTGMSNRLKKMLGE